MERGNKSPSASVQSLQTDSETTSVATSETSSDSTLTSGVAKSTQDTHLPHSDPNESTNETNLVTGICDLKPTALPTIPSPLPSSTAIHTSVPSKPAHLKPDDYVYNLKWIYFRGASRPIVTQNENGPCPIIAIANVLLLNGNIILPTGTALLTGHRLVALLSDLLLAQPVPSLDDDQLLNYESAVSDTFNIFPNLQTGLDINVRFTAVSAFEFTSALSVFDLFKISLFHGWLVDPNDFRLASAVGDLTYNQLVERIICLKQSKNSDDVSCGLLMQDFLDRTSSQLTYHGLCELYSSLSDGQLAVFFRNNHYNAMYKTEGRIYLLVTDMGLLNEPNIVWESLVDVDGDTHFVDSSFRVYTTSVAASGVDTAHMQNIHSLNQVANLDRSPPAMKSGQLKQSPSVEELKQMCTNLSKVPNYEANEADEDQRLAAKLQLEEIEAAENQQSPMRKPNTSPSSYNTSAHKSPSKHISKRFLSENPVPTPVPPLTSIASTQNVPVIAHRSTLPYARSDTLNTAPHPHNIPRTSSHSDCSIL